MDIAVSIAVPGDVTALCGLLQVLFSQEAEFRPDHEAQARGLAAIVGDPATGEILVARSGGRVLGMVSLLYTVSTALGARVAWLEDVVVLPATRDAGVGGALLDAALAHAARRGCRRVTLLTDADNVAAQRFYQRRGFQHSPMIPMRVLLDTPGLASTEDGRAGVD